MFFESARAQAQTEYEEDGTNAAVSLFRNGSGHEVSLCVSGNWDVLLFANSREPTCMTGADKMGWSFT